MKKKVIATLLCAAMVFSATACGSKSKSLSPKEEYAAAVEKVNKAEGIDADMDMTISMELSGMSMDIKMDGSILTNKKSDTDADLAMDATAEIMGQKVPMKYYYTDGYFYMEAADQKSKAKMDLEKAQEKIGGATEMTNVQAKMVKDVKVKDDGDNRVFTYKLDPKKMDEYVKKSMNSIGDLASGAASGTDIKIKGYKGTMTVDKDGNPVEQTIKMEITTSAEGQEITMKADATVKYNKMGKDVKIEFPSFDGFKEVDESQLESK